MNSVPTRIKFQILKLIYNKGRLTASQIHFSNANQYLILLEREELILRKWVRTFKRFKEARINPKKLKEVKKILGVDYE